LGDIEHLDDPEGIEYARLLDARVEHLYRLAHLAVAPLATFHGLPLVVH
jgi:hypothetical protein